MKKVLGSCIYALFFVSCGSSPSSDRVAALEIKVPSGFTGYILSDYLLPPSDTSITTYKYKNDNFVKSEILEYTSNNGLVTQTSQENASGYVSYHNQGDDDLEVTLYHDSTAEKFSIHNFVNIKDTITFNQSECHLAAHHDSLQVEDKNFEDVLEIRCPKSVGYYKKFQGLVLENLQTTVLKPTPSYPNRTIAKIDGYQPKYLTNFNLASAIEVKVDKLWKSPYNLNGQGIKVGLVDGGSVLASHVELRGRITNLSRKSSDLHATHVAGTLISKGGHLPTSHGFANQAEIYALSYTEIFFANSVKKLADDYGIFISNHSYGYDGSQGLGEYDRESKYLDLAIRKNPYIIALMAAGNDGRKYKTDRNFTEWSLIKGGSNAKNVITVASVDNASDHISSFSNRGPIKGGRLKPDISVDGANVLSTSNYDDTAYKRMNGTSMATPAATGTVMLLSQRYQQVIDSEVRLDTMKAILFNTARDIENTGPDYKSGFGQIDAFAAVKVIDSMQTQDSLVKLDKIHQGERQRYFLDSLQTQTLKVTVAWVDDSYDDCNDCANDILINDIDMFLIEEHSGKKIYPFTLNEQNPNAFARQDKENHLDPQEQIVFPMKAGSYTLHLSGKKISPQGQDFTLVSSVALSDAQKDRTITAMDAHIHKIYNAIK